jgi:hypothetical protein
MTKSGMSIDPAATDAEIGTVVAQLGLGRHLSGPPHGARTSHIRQGLSTGLLERRRWGDQTLNFAESLGDFTTAQKPQSRTFATALMRALYALAPVTVVAEDLRLPTVNSLSRSTISPQAVIAELQLHLYCLLAVRYMISSATVLCSRNRPK